MSSNEQVSPFEAEIARAEKQLQKAQRSIEAVKLKLFAGDVTGAYLEAYNFADAAEKLTLTARQLPAYTGHPQASKSIDRHITNNVPVQIGFTAQGWFGVVIPALLPKKSKGSADYIREVLYLTLSRFHRGREPVRYTDCVIIFRHVYRRDRPERQYRDHDNIELNAVVDAVALYVLFDDSPLRCAHHYCSAAGDENRTEVFVVPRREFESWILNAKSYDGKGVILYEDRP